MKRWGIFLLGFITLAGIFYGIISRNQLKAGMTPLYINLRDSPIYIKSGFERENLHPSTSEWIVIEPHRQKDIRTIKIRDLSLTGKPKRTFLSPFRIKEQEFTMLIPFMMTPLQMEMLNSDNPPPPGFFFASLGDNWEIFLNGTSVKSEIHLDNEGRIISGRTYRHISFPVDRSLFRPGENVLGVRIVGDPTFNGTGMFYASPYYLDTYPAILSQHNEIIRIALYFIYFFVAFNHFLMFLTSREERYNLYYSMLSVLLGIYFLSRTAAIYAIIPNSNIMERIEYAALFMVVPAFAAFFEQFNAQKLRLPTKMYILFCGFLAITQGVFSLEYGHDVLIVWDISALFASLYVFIRYVIYPFFFITYNQSMEKKSIISIYKKNLISTPLGNLLIGFIFLFASAIVDIVDNLFWHYALSLSSYSFFMFTIGTSFILARNTRKLYDTMLQTRILQGQLDAYVRRVTTIEGFQRQAGEMRHEMKNLLFALKIDMEQQNYENVNNRIVSLLGDLKQVEPDTYTGVSLIDAVISYKAAQVRELGAHFNIHSDSLVIESFDTKKNGALSYDIASIMGIALDNVVDAVNALKPKDTATVYCLIQQQNNMLVFRFTNPLPSPLLYKKGEIQTTKTESGHGMGIPALRRVVQKYNGEVSITDSDNTFSLSVMLFL